jgi:hypothetical protein
VSRADELLDLERRVRLACMGAKAIGVELTRHDFGIVWDRERWTYSDGPSCCGLGAVIVHEQPPAPGPSVSTWIAGDRALVSSAVCASRILEIDPVLAEAFVSGWDGDPHRDFEADSGEDFDDELAEAAGAAYRLGGRLAIELVGTLPALLEEPLP